MQSKANQSNAKQRLDGGLSDDDDDDDDDALFARPQSGRHHSGEREDEVVVPL